MTQSPPNFGLQPYQYSGFSSPQQYSSPRWEIPSPANGYGQSGSSFSSPMYQYQPSSLGTRLVQPVDSSSSSGLSGDFFRSSAPFQGTSGGGLPFSGSSRPSFECKREFSVTPKVGPGSEYSKFLKSEPPFRSPELSLKDRSGEVASAFPLQKPQSGSFPTFADRKFSVESKMLDHSLRNRSGAFSLGAPSQRSSSTDFLALAERSFSAESRMQDLSLRGRAGDFPSGFPSQRSALDSFSGFVARNFSVEFRDHSALSSQRPGFGSFQGSSALSRMPLASSGPASFDLSQSQFKERINRTMQRTFRGDFSPSRPLFTQFERFLFSKSVAITLEKGMNRTVFVFSPNPTTTFIIDPKNLGESLRQMAAKTSVVLAKTFSQEVISGLKTVLTPPLLSSLPVFSGQGSMKFMTTGKRDPHLRIGGINGLNNSLDEAVDRARYIGSFAPDHSIDWVYNHSNGIALDLAEVFTLNYLGVSPNTSQILRSNWIAFHIENAFRPDAKYLQYCHSQGAIHVLNALNSLPREIQQRIIVVAIAPAAVIPENVCFASFNYASKKDIVPRGELIAAGLGNPNPYETSMRMEMVIEKHLQQLILLDPHPAAKGLDHDFESPTFKERIQRHAEYYLKRDGEYKKIDLNGEGK